MATYSGLWDGVFGEPYTLLINRNPLNRQLGRALKRRSLTRLREAIDTVVASSSINGGAVVSYKRVAESAVVGDPATGGGAAEIETVTQIAASSSTTTADASNIDAIVNFTTQPASYPVDLSGNGGGNKLLGRSY